MSSARQHMLNAPDVAVDVCVVGGGPAGAVAATLLASWGHSVVMIHRDPRQSGLAESLPGSTRKLFGFLGLLHAVDEEQFQPNWGNVSEWAGNLSATRSDVAGYHVERSEFDAALRRHAVRHSVNQVSAVVRDVVLGSPSEITCQAPDGTRRTLYARFVLDCSGRAGVVRRLLGDRVTAGYRTVALIAEWDASGWPGDEMEQTVVESYAEGWAWSVPVVGNRRVCAVMVDPKPTQSRGAGLNRDYLSELEKAGGFSRRLTSCRQRSRAWACDATVYRSVRAGDAGVLLVGDAASFVEPLSSAGVRKAMTSAWRAAVLVNTSLSDAGMSSIGLEYFEQRERAVYSECVERAGAFFSAAAAYHRTDFWACRDAAGAAVLSTRNSTRASETPASIVKAFQQLRDSPASLRFVAGDRLHFGAAPEIEGRLLTLQEGVVLPGDIGPSLFAGGVRLAAVARIALDCRGVHQVIHRYETEVGVVRPDELLSALALLVAKGALVLFDGVSRRERHCEPASTAQSWP